MLDAHLTLKDHISSKCVKATSNIIRIRSVRKYLTEDAAKTLMSGLVLSHLDYANALLTGIPRTDLDKLQRVQNFAARVVKGLKNMSQISTTQRLPLAASATADRPQSSHTSVPMFTQGSTKLSVRSAVI